MQQGKVYLVGAGPGDDALTTMKAYRLLRQADVILHDHLIPHGLLQLARPNAEIIPVGKFAGRHTIPQDEINKTLIEKAKAGNVVVRLKGGDPYLFGRGGEEALACADAGVDFEVVPGVTSALAAPAYAGIPPTHRDYTSSVAIVTGHRKDSAKIEIPKAGTVIFLMSVANIEKIVKSLLEDGWPSNTPIAAIENGSCYDQRTITGTLENFLTKVKEAQLKTPAVFVVGKVVELQQKLDWFDKKSKILFLGTHPEKYRHLGTIVHRPIIDCVALDDYSAADAVIAKIDSFDWLVFTSVNGAKFLFARLLTRGSDARALANAKIAAIGKTTAQFLKFFGIVADLVPETESSSGLLVKFAKIDLKGKKILLPRAEIASDELPSGLMDMHALVEKITVYKTIDIDPGPIDFEFIDQILFTSASTVRAFVKRFAKVPDNIKAFCLGPPTLAEAKKHNITAQILT